MRTLIHRRKQSTQTQLVFLKKGEMKRLSTMRPKIQGRSTLTGETMFLLCVKASDGIRGTLPPLRRLKNSSLQNSPQRSRTPLTQAIQDNLDHRQHSLTTQSMINRFFKTGVPVKKVKNVLRVTYKGPLRMVSD